MQYICIAIPVIDYPIQGYQPGDMRVKLQEEANELIDEIESADFDQRRMLSELLDVLQVTVGMIRQQAREVLPPGEASKLLENVIQRAALDHRLKVEEYAQQRAWEIAK
ncbi:hypothetical protein AK95_14725 [Paenibacillus sp. LC231]|uniref:hypothetical protein n=1 Tax=Paenibacillus sp. LC231 TaxID=1120679 RepID=UPI0008DC7ADB|nr:hypothetical protein [Paenibacillus sp. LC231]OIB04867.1 hypothetical protein AK95_14725 [Paenibacillus sp. LC231]